jgi:hypothetical protein
MNLPQNRVYRMLYAWYSHTFVELDTIRCRWLAKLVCALGEAGCCTLPALATGLQRLGLSAATNESTQVAIRRFLSDDRITPEAAYAPLVRATLAGWPSEVCLLIVDLTSLKDRLWRLQVSLAYHGRSIPLSWELYPGAGLEEGATLAELFTKALDAAQAVLPPGKLVIVLLDRGFVSPQLWDAITQRGWHPVLRALRSVRLRTADGREQAVGELVTVPDEVVTVAGAVFKKAKWRAASVTGVRRDGQQEAWLVLSDLPPSEQRLAEYAIRMHIEQSFRDDKRHGWHWESSRITQLARASRLLLLLHLATLWCLSLGAVAMTTGHAPRWIRPSRPEWSLFRIGLTWLREALAQGDLLPLHHRCTLVPGWHTPLTMALAPGQT